MFEKKMENQLLAKRQHLNRAIKILIAIAIAIPAALWIADAMTPQSGMFAHLGMFLAMVLAPVIWLVGNFATAIAVLLDRERITKLFWLQCAVSGVILAIGIAWMLTISYKNHLSKVMYERQSAVEKNIINNDINQYHAKLKACVEDCLNDEFYREQLALAVRYEAANIFDELIKDSRIKQVDWLATYSAPTQNIADYSCAGYYLGQDTNVFEMAVLHQSSTMLKKLLSIANQQEKDSALWYAARANRIDFVQLALAAGANKDITGEYNFEFDKTSLLDAAISGNATDVLQWLLNNGFPANGVLRKDETPSLKHTPLHSLIYAAHQEQQHFGNVNKSIQMLEILYKAGADDTIAAPREFKQSSQTPMQQLLDANVFSQSAAIVQAFVAQGLSKSGLTTEELKKLDSFMQTKLEKRDGDIDIETCAEKQLKIK